jgi:chaperonin cofactor prefoldin
MGIAIAIIAGLTVMTLIAAGFDYMGKKSKGVSKELEKRLEEIEKKMQYLESTLVDKEEEIKQLGIKIEFMDRLLEDKTEKER